MLEDACRGLAAERTLVGVQTETIVREFEGSLIVMI